MATVSDTLISDLTKALALSQRDLTNQDNFFFGTGDVDITKMDNTKGKKPSLASLISKLGDRGSLGTHNLNEYDGTKEGKYHQENPVNATAARNYPASNVAGVLLVYQTGYKNSHTCLQIFITAEAIPDVYFRFGDVTATTATTANAFKSWAKFQNNKDLNLVLNHRQAVQYKISASQGNTSKYYKIATLKNTDGSSNRIAMMVSGGIDSGQKQQYVDYLFLTGRNLTADIGTAATGAAAYTAKDFKNPDDFISIQRLGRWGVSVDDEPQYGYVRRSGGTAAQPTTEFDFYIRAMNYGTDIFLTVLDATPNVIDVEPNASTDALLIFYPNTAVSNVATAPANYHNVSVARLFDTRGPITTVSNGGEIRIATPSDGTAFIFRNGTAWGCNKGSTKVPLGLQYGGTGATGADDAAAATAARAKLGVSYGTGAGTVAQGNDSRLNTVDGKSGGTINGSLTLKASGQYSGGLTTAGSVASGYDITATRDITAMNSLAARNGIHAIAGNPTPQAGQHSAGQLISRFDSWGSQPAQNGHGKLDWGSAAFYIEKTDNWHGDLTNNHGVRAVIGVTGWGTGGAWYQFHDNGDLQTPKGLVLTKPLSDRNFKDKIKDLDPAISLNNLLKMRPRSFVFKNDNAQTIRRGFIAQEIEEIDPEYVNHEFLLRKKELSKLDDKGNVVKAGYENREEVLKLDTTPILLDAVISIQALHKELKELQELRSEVTDLRVQLEAAKLLITDFIMKK
ncbi:hypothetical protein SB5439_04976 [Klebsiella variicola]|uniref:pyocin knob domain-containing S74 family peptidase n=1 Tax=Klebsiella variicola TaxID=244366 RepID=UPI00109CA662|nr:pyocin knob domain-containing S74 family peptidase [Klebsiella variicola]VGQ11637.1 hypothetical protein SB5439_04976 [Klebsiella variicola]